MVKLTLLFLQERMEEEEVHDAREYEGLDLDALLSAGSRIYQPDQSYFAVKVDDAFIKASNEVEPQQPPENEHGDVSKHEEKDKEKQEDKGKEKEHENAHYNEVAAEGDTTAIDK